MAQHNETGKNGETIAKEYIIKKGYEILETNWRFQKAEVDIIAKYQNRIIAIEVKTRSSINFGRPQDFVNKKKIRLLLKALDHYLNSKDLDFELRFDIIAITIKDSNHQIEHLEDAFCIFDP